MNNNIIPFSLPKLPPTLDLSKHIPLITSAHSAVARYDETQKKLPNPEIIAIPLSMKEAQRSSQIEGTEVTLQEVFAADDTKAENTEKEKDFREIWNYREAIVESRALLDRRPLSENVIKELHAILLNSVRGRNKAPGEFRKHMVHIGSPGSTAKEARYIPPAPNTIPMLFSNLMQYIQDDTQPDRLVQAAVMHYQFEAIHPFSDGNGRVGRILVPVYLYEKKLTSNPNLYISEFLEMHRRDYYEALNRVDKHDDWDGWIVFFLRAVRAQAETLKERVDSVNNLYNKYHSRLDEFSSKYASNLLTAIFCDPIFSAKRIGEAANINNTQTLYALLSKFQEKGILKKVDSRKPNIYLFPELLNIIDGLGG
ncbi:Fic family protein [Candidatus Saccharibacteria bacterium]|nr:Fic family protein [Candidatus Saccharibacteria bacterium]